MRQNAQSLATLSYYGFASFIAFAVIGFINTLVPFLIFAATHFIIAFPLPIVLVIQLSPQVITKLCLPHILHRIWPPIRPVLIASLWMLVNFLTILQPPNVEPPTRILENMLAAALAASTEVLCLGLTINHGTVGLSGWGFGTAAGAIACAAGTYIWTFRMAHSIRDALAYVWYLIPVLLVALYFIGTSSHEEGKATFKKSHPQENIADNANDDNDDMELESRANDLLLPQNDDSAASPLGHSQKTLTAAGGVLVVIRPYMMSLGTASVFSAFIYPGILRINASTPEFGTFAAFSAAYGVAFHMGNLVARSSYPYVRVNVFKPTLIRLTFVCLILFINAVFGLVTYAIVLWTLAFVAGGFSGLVYINTFGRILGDDVLALSRRRQFSLGFVGAAESIGLLAGGVLRFFLERIVCSVSLESSVRWCQRST